jgi:hypothetical protein
MALRASSYAASSSCFVSLSRVVRDTSGLYQPHEPSVGKREEGDMASFASLRIINEQHLLVPEAADLVFDLLQTIMEKLHEVAVPGVSSSVQTIASGALGSLFGRSRDYLVVAFDRFPEHSVLIGVTEIGRGMHVSFYVATSSRLARRVRRAFLFAWDPERRDEVGSELGPRQAAALSVRIEAVRFCLDQALNAIAGGGGAPLGTYAELKLPELRHED